MKRVHKLSKLKHAAATPGSRSKKRVQQLQESCQTLPGSTLNSAAGAVLTRRTDEPTAPVNASLRAGKPFNPIAAAFYGQFLEAAYTMYAADPNNITPAQSSDFPPGYQLSAWVQMQDFILGSTIPKFYGFIAQNTDDPNQFILAIRGTSNGMEWWDDANAILKVPFSDPASGSVAYGFARIYNTLKVVECRTSATAAAFVPQTMTSVGGFSRQVSALVRRRAAATAQAAGVAPSASIAISGHSLGAALATLYALDNARNDQTPAPLLCTFASPRVGDSTFASAFNGLGLASWRLVNSPDVVPHFPPEFLGFSHVNALQLFNSSGKVKSSPSCWHSLATYLSLIDTQLQPAAGCRPTAVDARPPASPSLAATTNLSIAAGSTTVNITIHLGNHE
jgi:hypothetical protein